ncbi:hypothetical protein SUDANB19_03931 [Streptomyces sp. enrichment culture]
MSRKEPGRVPGRRPADGAAGCGGPGPTSGHGGRGRARGPERRRGGGLRRETSAGCLGMGPRQSPQRGWARRLRGRRGGLRGPVGLILDRTPDQEVTLLVSKSYASRTSWGMADRHLRRPATRSTSAPSPLVRATSRAPSRTACGPSRAVRRSTPGERFAHTAAEFTAPVPLPSDVVHASDPATGAVTLRDADGTGKPHVTGRSPRPRQQAADTRSAQSERRAGAGGGCVAGVAIPLRQELWHGRPETARGRPAE